MQGWQYVNLNKTLTANHPVENHSISGPNSALGKGKLRACHVTSRIIPTNRAYAAASAELNCEVRDLQ